MSLRLLATSLYRQTDTTQTNQREGNDQLRQLRQGGILHQEEDTQEHENCGLNVMLVSITIHYRVPIWIVSTNHRITDRWVF